MTTKAQEIFDRMWHGLTAQGWIQSIRPDGVCAYRDPKGRMCAAAHATPPELRGQLVEGRMFASHSLAFINSVTDGDKRAEGLIAAAQIRHDAPLSEDPAEMKSAFEALAARYGLRVPECGDA